MQISYNLTFIIMEKIELTYSVLFADWSVWKENLVIETRVESFAKDEEIVNPSENEKWFFYGISINGLMEQVTTFKPGVEWFESMTKNEAEKYLEMEIIQIKANYNIS